MSTQSEINLEGILDLSCLGFQDIVNLNYLANLHNLSVPTLKQKIKVLSSTGVINYKDLQEFLDFPY